MDGRGRGDAVSVLVGFMVGLTLTWLGVPVAVIVAIGMLLLVVGIFALAMRRARRYLAREVVRMRAVAREGDDTSARSRYTDDS